MDEFAVIVFDGDAELYTTADGSRVQVLCTPSGFAADSSDTEPQNTHTNMELPRATTSRCGDATPLTPATTEAAATAAVPCGAMPSPHRDSEEALWSGRRTKFLIECYNEHFCRIGKKGGLRELQGAMQAPEAAPSQTASVENTQVEPCKLKKDSPLVQLLHKLDEIKINRAAGHEQKIALLEHFMSAYEAKT
ncbi:hypothetical protein HPB49_026410 [Dermacentor silvarum]|nr:hypothetical protein HPB49_026410 [Dermacentor silvarum]